MVDFTLKGKYTKAKQMLEQISQSEQILVFTPIYFLYCLAVSTHFLRQVETEFRQIWVIWR